MRWARSYVVSRSEGFSAARVSPVSAGWAGLLVTALLAGCASARGVGGAAGAQARGGGDGDGDGDAYGDGDGNGAGRGGKGGVRFASGWTPDLTAALSRRRERAIDLGEGARGGGVRAWAWAWAGAPAVRFPSRVASVAFEVRVLPARRGAEIAGFVRDRDGNPVEARLRRADRAGGGAPPIFTSAQGNFHFRRVPAGLARVTMTVRTSRWRTRKPSPTTTPRIPGSP